MRHFQAQVSSPAPPRLFQLFVIYHTFAGKVNVGKGTCHSGLEPRVFEFQTVKV